jgi:uncharacterized membrane protein
MPLCGKTLFRALAFCSILSLNLTLSAQDGSPTGKCGFQNLTIQAPAGSSATPTDLNDKGAIVGTLSQGTASNFHVTGFLVNQGKLTSFRFPGSRDTLPRDINNNAVIVGSFDVVGGNGQRAFMVHAGGFREVKIPGFPNAPARANGINDLGDIVGSFNGNGSNFGFLLHKGKLTIISFPGAAGGTGSASINNQGVVVGQYHLSEEETADHGFMWKNGAFTNIQVPGARSTTPNKINNNGDIVGTFLDANFDQHGFSFDKGVYRTIDHPGGSSTQLFGLNDFDNVLGAYSTTKNVLFKGFCSSVF